MTRAGNAASRTARQDMRAAMLMHEGLRPPPSLGLAQRRIGRRQQCTASKISF